MSVNATSKSSKLMGRRSALLVPLVLGGCSLFDDWFGERKPSLPGKREAVFADRRGLVVDEGAPKIVLPEAVRNAARIVPGAWVTITFFGPVGLPASTQQRYAFSYSAVRMASSFGVRSTT